MPYVINNINKTDKPILLHSQKLQITIQTQVFIFRNKHLHMHKFTEKYVVGIGWYRLHLCMAN